MIKFPSLWGEMSNVSRKVWVYQVKFWGPYFLRTRVPCGAASIYHWHSSSLLKCESLIFSAAELFCYLLLLFIQRLSWGNSLPIVWLVFEEEICSPPRGCSASNLFLLNFCRFFPPSAFFTFVDFGLPMQDLECSTAACLDTILMSQRLHLWRILDIVCSDILPELDIIIAVATVAQSSQIVYSWPKSLHESQ